MSKPDTGKPSLMDQHWRLSLASKKADVIKEEMVDAVTTNNTWRFQILLQLPLMKYDQEDVLCAAVEKGRLDMFHQVVSLNPRWKDKADINDYGRLSVLHNHLSVLTYLVENHGLDIHERAERLLELAAEEGFVEITSYLLDKGADPAARHGAALVEAAKRGRIHTADLLLKRGLDVNIDESNALQKAVAEGQLPMTLFLMARGAVMNEKYANIALDKASENGFSDILFVLLQKYDYKDKAKEKALETALWRGKLKSAQALIDSGTDIQSTNCNSLISTAFNGYTQVVQFIIENGGDINALEKGETPLMAATRGGRNETVQYLLEAGADPSLMRYGAVRLAIEHGRRDLARMIVQHNRLQKENRRKEKQEIFEKAFGQSYTLDSLRKPYGDAGETGLTLAAQTGNFAKLVLASVDKEAAPLTADDLFQPVDQLQTVLMRLRETKSLQQFFDHRLWSDRAPAFQEALSALPENMRKNIKVAGFIANENLKRLAKKSNRRRRPPRL